MRRLAVASFAEVGTHSMLLALHDREILRRFADDMLGPTREQDRQAGSQSRIVTPRTSSMSRSRRCVREIDGLHEFMGWTLAEFNFDRDTDVDQTYLRMTPQATASLGEVDGFDVSLTPAWWAGTERQM